MACPRQGESAKVEHMRILGISGSLRAASTNTRLLLAATKFAPPAVDIHITKRIARLPLFNPDIAPEDSAAVERWIREGRIADGIIVSTPEYARGYPGALKNAFDWLVGTDAYVNKPFMLLNASARSTVAQQTLTTVLETMSGVHIEAATTTVPLLGSTSSVSEIVADSTFAAQLRKALLTFVTEVKRRTNPPPASHTAGNSVAKRTPKPSGAAMVKSRKP